MKQVKHILLAIFFLLISSNYLRSQQTTTWTSVSATVWESITTDGLVRVECRVSAGVSILGPETMGCTSAATYSDPAVFGSSSLEISASSFSSGTLEFHFFDADTNVPINIEQPIVHADKIGTFAIVLLVGKAATANFNLTNGTWAELSSNGPIFESNATTFNIDTNALLVATGGECGSAVNPGAGGGSMQLTNTTGSIEMNVNITGGLLSTPDEVEFVLTNLAYDPCTYEAIAGTVTINDPDADGLNNICDLDDDNDGILDTDEQSCVLGVCTFIDTDADGKFDHLDLDSDADGCSDADEAYANTDADGNDDSVYGLGSPVVDSNGLVIAAGVSGSAYTTIPATTTGGQNTFQEGMTITIATPPSNQQVCQGSDATFSAVATTAVVPTTPVTSATTDVAYRWQVSSDGTNYSDISGESGIVTGGTTVSLVIPNVNLGLNGNSYKVIFTNEANICSEEAAAVLNVQEAPDAGSNGTLTTCEGDTLTTAELFNVLGGTPDSGGTWSPALAGAGTYTYTVAATAPCTTDATAEVVVSEQAAPDAGTDGTLTICEGDTVTDAQLFAELGGTPDAGGAWSPALAGAGTYTYTVSATSPCTIDATAEVVVSEQAAPNAGSNETLTICEGEIVTDAQLFAELGGTPDSGGAWSPALAGAGIYTYTVTATAPCTTNETSEVVVSEQAAPDAGTNGTLTICEGETVTDAQLFAELGGTPDAGGAWSPALAGAGTYTYTVTATAPCTTDATSEVTVSEQAAPDAGTNGTLTICEGETITDTQLFNALGETPDTGGSWSPALAGAGTYIYTVSATAPCAIDATSEVIVSEQAVPDAGTNGALTICQGDTVTDAQLFAELGGTPDTDGTWSPVPTGAGTYTYSVGGTICSEASSSVTVTEEVRPNAGSNAALEICSGATVTQLQLFSLLGTDDTAGTWNPNPEQGGVGTYTYTVTGTICSDASAVVTVSISMLDSDGDTVTDCDENIHGTDPLNDCESIGGRPLPTSDCDNDRLTEEEEAMLGTNPLNPDTDGDGVIDGQEVTDATDPLDICDFLVESQTATPTNMWNSSDCDSDDLTNQDEIILSTDPTNPDTDGDTIKDGQEVLDMTDPLDPCDSNGGTPPLGASCEIYIENDMVTPGDIMNGNFEIINIHLFPDNAVEIHNRWGQLVWETEVYDNRNNAFDGVTKGKLTILENQKLPSGVYFYKVKYVANGQDKILSGYLYINR